MSNFNQQKVIGGSKLFWPHHFFLGIAFYFCLCDKKDINYISAILWPVIETEDLNGNDEFLQALYHFIKKF